MLIKYYNNTTWRRRRSIDQLRVLLMRLYNPNICANIYLNFDIFHIWLVNFLNTFWCVLIFVSCYSIVAFGAVLTTMTACYFVILQILLDDKINEDMNATVPHNGWDANQFFLSYGTILFTYGGASAFPTIQNDMFKKDEFSRSIIATFISKSSYRNTYYIHPKTFVFGGHVD